MTSTNYFCCGIPANPWDDIFGSGATEDASQQAVKPTEQNWNDPFAPVANQTQPPVDARSIVSEDHESRYSTDVRSVGSGGHSAAPSVRSSGTYSSAAQMSPASREGKNSREIGRDNFARKKALLLAESMELDGGEKHIAIFDKPKNRIMGSAFGASTGAVDQPVDTASEGLTVFQYNTATVDKSPRRIKKSNQDVGRENFARRKALLLAESLDADGGMPTESVDEQPSPKRTPNPQDDAMSVMSQDHESRYSTDARSIGGSTYRSAYSGAGYSVEGSETVTSTKTYRSYEGKTNKDIGRENFAQRKALLLVEALTAGNDKPDGPLPITSASEAVARVKKTETTRKTKDLNPEDIYDDPEMKSKALSNMEDEAKKKATLMISNGNYKYNEKADIAIYTADELSKSRSTDTTCKVGAIV